MKPTDALNSNFIRITTLHVSASLSDHHRGFLAVRRHWNIIADLVTVCYQEQDAAPGSKLHKMYHCRCMSKNSQWWSERLAKTCRVV